MRNWLLDLRNQLRHYLVIGTTQTTEIKMTTYKFSKFVVEAGKYQVGDTLAGQVITRLGRERGANSDDASAWGIKPWVETVQYAHFD
jgi:hypothetical protein